MEYYHENIQNDAGFPARIFFGGSGRDKLHYPLHWHHNLEFDLVLEGQLKGKIGNREVCIRQGGIFFVNSGELHETDARDELCLRTVTILLSEAVFKEYCPEFENYYFEIEPESSQQDEIRNLILECAAIYKEKEEFYELKLDICLRRLCLVLLQKCRRKKKESGREQSGYKSTKRMKECISYMEDHFEDSLTIEKMGSVMGMTPTYFSRFFKQSTGRTFHEYLTSIRLCRGQELLLENEKNITEIAYSCGFPNVKSFISAFKKMYEITPAKYKKIKNDNNIPK